MDVNIRDLSRLFGNQVQYEIPPYQRRYVWDQDGQWDALWEDVRNTAENVLEDGGVNTPHFLGAVVLQIKPAPAGGISTWRVVDGQQRLTTMQLLLDAVHEVFVERNYKNAAARLDVLVLNNKAFVDKDAPDLAFKVWPTTGDQDAFRHAMRNELPVDEYKDSLIVQAHEFFKLQTRQWLDDHPDDADARVGALYAAITSFLSMVVIDLDTGDDPHVIFETLNARGTPLLQSDLIKNMVLSEASKDKAGTDASEVWGFGDPWWTTEIQQGRLMRPQIDVFLNYWLTIRTRSDVRVADEFSAFRRYVSGARKPIMDVAADIGDVRDVYRVLADESKNIPGWEKFRYRRRVMQAGVLNPVLLWLLTSDVPQQQMDKAISAIESYLVRRMVCGMNNRSYGQVFMGSLIRLHEAGAEQAGDVTVEYLKSRGDWSNLWPDDRRLEDAFVGRPLYRLLTQGRIRIVLEGIEEELRTYNVELPNAPRNLTIEHVMPQAWRASWELPDDVEDEDKELAAHRRDDVVHRIGNLTLVTERLNSTLSNAPWSDKRGTLDKHSVLFLNKTLLDNAPDVWDEAAIAERAKQLCAAAAKVWPHADGIS